MFNIGMSEMILIFIVALIVFGPDKLPEIARTLGKSARELKKAGDDLVEAATDTKRAADIEVVGVRESLSKFKEAQAMVKDGFEEGETAAASAVQAAAEEAAQASVNNDIIAPARTDVSVAGRDAKETILAEAIVAEKEKDFGR